MKKKYKKPKIRINKLFFLNFFNQNLDEFILLAGCDSCGGGTGSCGCDAHRCVCVRG